MSVYQSLTRSYGYNKEKIFKLHCLIMMPVPGTHDSMCGSHPESEIWATIDVDDYEPNHSFNEP